jgi:Domain of unknown function (DUF4258)
MAYTNLTFRQHALQRMFEREIDAKDVRQVIEHGEVIKNYPDDKPYPSRLILGWKEGKPLHVVAADHSQADETIIITVYQPAPALWNLDFRSKKS